jgi:hypothetical protein
MLLEKTEHIGLAIVLLGDFNPAIFHPTWLSKNKLITEEESQQADINIVHKDLALFKVNWLNFEVTRERIKISTASEAYFETTRDMVLGIFRLLRHTPVSALGINNDFHFHIDDAKTLNKFFNNISPANNWDGVFKDPLFNSISIRGIREKGVTGYTTLNIQESSKIPGGLFILFNDHFAETEKKDGAYYARVLEDNWEDCMKQYKEYVEIIWEKNKPF